MLHFEQGQGPTGFTKLDHKTDFVNLKLLPDRLAKLYLYLLSKGRFDSEEKRKAHWRELGEFTGKSRARVFSSMAELVELGLAVGGNGYWQSTKNGTIEPLGSLKNRTTTKEGSITSDTPSSEVQHSSVSGLRLDSIENQTASPENLSGAPQKDQPEVKERNKRKKEGVEVEEDRSPPTSLEFLQRKAEAWSEFAQHRARFPAWAETYSIEQLEVFGRFAVHVQTHGNAKGERHSPGRYFLWLLAGERSVDAGFLTRAAEARVEIPSSQPDAPRFDVRPGDRVRTAQGWFGVLFASGKLIELEDQRYILPEAVLEHQPAPDQPKGDHQEGAEPAAEDPQQPEPDNRASREELERILADLEPDQVGKPEPSAEPANPTTKLENNPETHWHVKR